MKRRWQVTGIRELEYLLVRAWLDANGLRAADAVHLLALMMLKCETFQETLNLVNPLLRALSPAELRAITEEAAE